MVLIKELESVIEKCKSRSKKKSQKKEALTKDMYDTIGVILRNSAYFDFDPIDEEQGTYMISINVAGKEILQVNTKKEGDNIVYDSYEIDEGGLKAMVEFVENKAQELSNEGK
jgi:hypothetical protein